jgi:hypothetical protein
MGARVHSTEGRRARRTLDDVMPYPLPVGRVAVAVVTLIAVIRGIAALSVWLGWETTVVVVAAVALLVVVALLMHRRARARVGGSGTSATAGD